MNTCPAALCSPSVGSPVQTFTASSPLQSNSSPILASVRWGCPPALPDRTWTASARLRRRTLPVDLPRPPAEPLRDAPARLSLAHSARRVVISSSIARNRTCAPRPAFVRSLQVGWAAYELQPNIFENSEKKFLHVLNDMHLLSNNSAINKVLMLCNIILLYYMRVYILRNYYTILNIWYIYTIPHI